MSTSDDQVRRAAEVKLWLESRIAELEEEIQRLREALAFVDTTLRASTFRPAIEMLEPLGKEIAERREIKRDKGGEVVATASITSNSIVVAPTQGLSLRADIPPFKSFLVRKKLQGMKAKDEELATRGKLGEEEVLRFDVQERNGLVSKVVVENYREKSRMTEILNTVSWTFSRMLEK
jgi:hypothetical protein